MLVLFWSNIFCHVSYFDSPKYIIAHLVKQVLLIPNWDYISRFTDSCSPKHKIFLELQSSLILFKFKYFFLYFPNSAHILLLYSMASFNLTVHIMSTFHSTHNIISSCSINFISLDFFIVFIHIILSSAGNFILYMLVNLDIILHGLIRLTVLISDQLICSCSSTEPSYPHKYSVHKSTSVTFEYI
jgi:hypothetical protein